MVKGLGASHHEDLLRSVGPWRSWRAPSPGLRRPPWSAPSSSRRRRGRGPELLAISSRCT